MASIKESVETNKKILLLIAVALIVVTVSFTKFYRDQKRENRALRLKILSLSETKRTPKPWAQLMAVKPQTPTATTKTPAAQTTNETNTSASTQETQNIDAQDTQELAVRLNSQMKRVKNLDVASIDNNIAIADEIISREPDSYGAYKAKLISLLTKEGKFNQPPDEVEVEGLLENMAQFNISSDNIARREAALISNTSNDIQNVESQLEDLARQKETLESQLDSFKPDSPELADLSKKMQEIDEREDQLTSNIDSLETHLAENSAQIANEDVIEIPFMRMMAKSDYEGVIENAQSFINEFPSSPSGYFYMIRALEMQGQKEEGLNVIKNSHLPLNEQQSLLQRLKTQGQEDPKNYWQKLSF